MDFCVINQEKSMDLYVTNPGPMDASVLYDQDKHVSSAVWEGQVHASYFCYSYFIHLYFFLSLFKLYNWCLFEEFH